jgi:hypothetical protein
MATSFFANVFAQYRSDLPPLLNPAQLGLTRSTPKDFYHSATSGAANNASAAELNARRVSFNHLISQQQQRLRDREAERAC